MFPTFAWAKVNVGVPPSVVSSPDCTSDSPAETGTVTWFVALVVASYWRLVTVNEPVTVKVRWVIAAVVVAVVLWE